jgi:hypothetical protein
MVESIDWRFLVRFVSAAGQMPEFTLAARTARDKARAQTLFLAAKRALLRDRRTGTPKAVPTFGRMSLAVRTRHHIQRFNGGGCLRHVSA